MVEKAIIIEKITKALLEDSKLQALSIIIKDYPFEVKKIHHRQYSIHQKMKVFMKDGFLDRYTDEKLINPGIIKILSNYFPKEFPYHSNWKMTETHTAYWNLFPTVDHLIPIAQGGIDEESNYVTTSMFNNSIKSNWSLEQLRWQLHEAGDIREWDGLTRDFLLLIEKDSDLLNDRYIKDWYNASKKIVK